MSLLELIDGLPSASRFTQAQMNDPEVADQIAVESGSGKWHPEVREFDTNAVLLARLLQATQDVSRAVIASVGGKPGRGEPMPIPRTLVDDRRKELMHEAAFDLIDELYGGG